ASDVDLRKFESDLIPTRFWYRRLSQELTERMNAYQTGSQESSSLVVWRDVSALRVNVGKYPQYFLFDERCASLTQIGEKAIVREISLGIGPKRFELIKRAAKDSLEKGIEVLLIHKDPDDQLPFSEDEIPARFSAPRRILRSSIGSSLDAFLGGRPKIDEGLPMFAYAPIAEDS
ncbi:MAG: hypothetical protein M1587_04730, partial [Thaumarchaeota archaeon]|nr:hypothetical protein [Nitrososphaerota archaeon]